MLHWTVYLKAGPKVFNDAAVSVGHKVYSFGGYDASNTKPEQLGVKIFNTVSLVWTNLPPVTDWLVQRPLEVPNMCWGHTAVLIEDIVYIWGGFKLSVVLYAFDVNTDRWFRPRNSRAVPEARCNHSACVLGKVMYVHGGYTQRTGRTNDILKLDTTTMVWALINTGGTLAPVSLCHSATIIGTKMFVFGGRSAMGHYNNIRVFDTDTNSWLSTPPVQLLPEGRGWHSAFAYNDELYIFGGDNLDRTFSDLWKFNPDAFSWKNVAPKGKGPCVMTGMCCCTVGDHIILFGGYRYTYDDLYILDLSPSLKTLCKLTVIQYGLEHSGLLQDIRLELVAMTTNNDS